MSDDRKFQRFGKYLILDHLVDGGMAKICRARFLGEQANKMVAIKMVQPQFSNDETFARMFQDELNITFGMQHPNIMQVYDYGKVKGQLYTAMEYIHGLNLKQFFDRLKETKVTFPVETCCYIISQVSQGLHYAHTFTDKLTGKPFNIVHRDISPHNIMLTYDGAVKVIDFGIAKAATNSEATQAGTIKGKLSYLAPEYLDGIELDARYDQFAVGITLWEMLCSRKLFQANNDLAVLKLIQACKIIPPSEINPRVPKELDAIVMKALSKDRSHRYENMDQLNRALVRFLYSQYPDFNSSDLKTFANDLFKGEIEKDQKKFFEYGAIDITPYIDDLKNEESRTGKISKKAAGLSGRPTSTHEPTREKVRELDLAIDPLDVELGIEKTSEDETNSTRKLNRAALQTVKSNSKYNRSSSSSIRKPLLKDKTSSKITTKRQIQNKNKEGSSVPFLIGFIACSFVTLAYIQPKLIENIFGFNLYNMIHPNAEVNREISSESKLQLNKQRLSRNISDGAKNFGGKVILGNVDISMEVLINGEKTNYIGRPLNVDLDKDIVLKVFKSGYQPFKTKIRLSKENNSIVVNVPKMERSKIGVLSTSRNYAVGSKLVYNEDGERVERDLPFKEVEISEGTYQAKVINPMLGTEINVEFTIEENKKHFLD